MSEEPWLPVRPDLTQLRHQAKDLLREMRRANPAAKLADAQHALAKKYGAENWARVVQCCELIDAIWKDDVDTVRELVLKHPNLLTENAGIRNNNWGPPLSYAANLGRDSIIEMLRNLGATDLMQAMDRAVLQSRIHTAMKLHRALGSPKPPPGALGSPAYTLSVTGTQFLFNIGAEMLDEQGRPDAPVDVVLESDSRNPPAKHAILEMYAGHGFELPDTPMMALHRGRIDLLSSHLDRDRSLPTRTFSWSEIYPPDLKCQPIKPDGDEHLPRTPINGGTLLHAAVEFDEVEIVQWLLGKGMHPDVPAAVIDGFGGHTALFNVVACHANFWINYQGGWAQARKPKEAPIAKLLLDAGANPNARADLRVGSHFSRRGVTPIGWGQAFPKNIIVNEAAMALIAKAGGIA